MGRSFPQSISLFAPAQRAAVVRFLTTQGGLLLCGLFLLVGLGLAGDYGIWGDEWFNRDTVRANLRYILGQTDRVDAPFLHERWYGVAFELPLLLAEGAMGREDYYYVHRLRESVTHLLFLAGGFFCYLLAYRLFNNRLIAIFALLLFLLHPRIYAHSFFNAKDLPFLSMFVIALYLTERAFRKNTLGAFLLLGIAVGIATNLRIMGIMLLLAVIGLRVLDAALAKGWGERKGILATGGLFVAAAGLTWYALGPNAWSGPLTQLTGALSLTTDHPAIMPTLFQGELLPSDELPAHYGLTWFMTTTPPVFLLLGAVGIVAVLARGLTRPGAVWVNERLRFGWLLAGCCGLPLLGVALAGSNIYGEWRHLYFIYVPFALLAAGGLYWIAGALFRLRWRRAGVYGLFGLGLGLTLLQMAQLHPLQQIYFNFLVDEATANHRWDLYPKEYKRLRSEAGLAYLLERHPGETLAVNRLSGHPTMIRPPQERRRLIMDSPVHDRDYLWGDTLEKPHRPDRDFNTLYLTRYNDAVASLRVLEGSRMTAAMRAGYAEVYQAAVDGEPIIRGEYDVYLEGRRVTFVKENCHKGERAGRFRAKVYRDGADSRGGGMPNLADYNFYGNYGVRVDGRCLAVIQLPEEPTGQLAVGRYIAAPGGLAFWEAAHSFTSPSRWDLAAADLGDNMPGATAGAGFELYRQGRRLIYYREGCTAGDTAAPFFLHITPEDVGDLPRGRRRYGFDSWGFHFGQRGLRFDGQCAATFELPDYAIAGIRTGQEGYWEFRGLPPVEPGVLRERAAALAGAAADYRGKFDLFWQDGELIYRREGCAAADTAAGFFLHIAPVDGTDLAAARREYGFEGRDFEFSKWGGRFDGQCVAAVPLPGYEIAGIRTGQYAAGTGEVWSAELSAP